MTFFKEKIKEPARTQVVARGLKLDELINTEVMNELKEKFKEEGELVATNIQFTFLPKPKPPEEIKKGKEVVITLKAADFIEFNHPSPKHYQQDLYVITASRNRLLEKLFE